LTLERIHINNGLLRHPTHAHRWVTHRLRRQVHRSWLKRHVLWRLHTSFNHLILNVVEDLVGEHVDHGAQRLLLLNLKVFVVITHDYIKEVLIMRFHLIAFEVVILQLVLKQDFSTTLASEFEDASLGLLDRWVIWHPLWHPRRRPLVTIHRLLALNIVRHYFANS